MKQTDLPVLGAWEGTSDGIVDGRRVGNDEGSCVGMVVGLAERDIDGIWVWDGESDGDSVGT